MKYFQLIEKWFPDEAYYIAFQNQGLDYLIEIRVNDYVLRHTFHSFGIEKMSSDAEKIIDDEIEYMLEAIKGKLDDIKANRKLP